MNERLSQETLVEIVEEGQRLIDFLLNCEISCELNEIEQLTFVIQPEQCVEFVV